MQRFFPILVSVALSACATAAPVTAPAVVCDRAATETEASFSNAGVDLAGLWFRPEGASDFPALVILQGSGTSGRSNKWSRSFAEALSACGVGVLLTDKRGSDKSGGDWRTATFEDLAKDGAAALEWAAAQDGVDARRLGFLGLSQGGHIAPLAALTAPGTDFFIDAVGSSLPMKETLLHELEQTYRQYGLNDEQVAFLQRLTYASFVYLETGDGWDEYLAVRAEIAASPFAQAAESWPTSQEDPYWTFWRGIHDFDPIPHWREAVLAKKIPALVLYGELDEQDNVPVTASVARLNENVASPLLKIVVYPETGHALYDPARPGELHPDMLDLLTRFVIAGGKS